VTKADVMERLARDRLVPVVRAPSSDSALNIVEALLEGGISTLELTMTVPGAIDVIREISKRFGDKTVLGAGTVLDSETALACAAAGAQFIVSPGFDRATVAACNQSGICVAPGALTPTEVLIAWREGADIVKIFPCDAMGGASYIKSIKAPLPHIPLMPTGGVTLENLVEFLRAGATAVGVGSNLANHALSHETIVERAMRFNECAKAAIQVA
jgi:2-dehydro-3-deoxyphosphogluconate aldolase/(4S)-4-hydroxy-2-oxoglutarate aldolase